MSVGAAIRITSDDEERVIRHAAEFAREQGVVCFIISIVDELPYGADADGAPGAVRRNLELIGELDASPVMQEGDDVATTLLAVAPAFGVRTLFVQSGTVRMLGRSISEKLIYLDPPFDVVVIGSV